jgi:hypothetical protein
MDVLTRRRLRLQLTGGTGVWPLAQQEQPSSRRTKQSVPFDLSVTEQRSWLDLRSRGLLYLEALVLDQLLDPVDDEDVTVIIDVPDITGVEPSLGVYGVLCFLVVPLHHSLAPDA